MMKMSIFEVSILLIVHLPFGDADLFWQSAIGNRQSAV